MLQFHAESSLEAIESPCEGGLYLVGSVFSVDGAEEHELLLAGDSKEGSTCIYIYGMKSKELQLVYEHEGLAKVVGASLDGWRSILAVTTLETRVREEETQAYFKTALAEVLPTGEQYRLNVRSQLIQSVEFVYDERQPKTTVFLFFIDGAFIRLYQIYSRKRRAGGLKITTQPVMLSEIVKKFHWFQFDKSTNQLYVLLDKGGGVNVLRCYRFPRTEKLIFEISLDVDIPKAMRGFEPYRQYPWDGRVRTHARRGIRLLNFGESGMCLCVQLLTGELFVFVLQHNVCLELGIHDTTYFCALGDLLALFVPGRSLQLLDVGREHAPLASLCLHGGDYAPRLARCSALRAFDMTPTTGGVMVGGNVMFNGSTGEVLSFRLDSSHLPRIFTLNSPTLHCQLMHVILAHMRDAPMAEFVLRECLRGNLPAASPELFAEYLLGSVYDMMERESLVPHPVLESFPVSSLAHMTAPDFYDPHVERVSLVTSYNTARSGKLAFTLRKTYDTSPLMREFPRFDLRSLTSPERAPPSSSSSSSSPLLSASPSSAGSGGLSRVVQILFGSEENVTSPLADLVDDPELVSNCALSSHQYVECVAEELCRKFPKENRMRCYRWARLFRDLLLQRATRVYEYICEAVPAMDDERLFRMLEYLYCALEELNVPLPRGFATHFAAAGFRCLSRQLFLQYVDRGIFYLTDAFIARVLSSLDEEEREMRFQLLSRIRSVDVMLNSIWDREEDSHVLMQYLSPRLRVNLPQTDVELLESVNESFFIPWSVFAQHLQLQAPELSGRIEHAKAFSVLQTEKILKKEGL